MKKILITGIAGFIGSSTAFELVKRGYDVIGIDNLNDYYNPKIKEKRVSKLEQKGIKVYKNEILDLDLNSLFASEKIDAVLHIAASAGVRPSIESPEFFVKNNILVTTKILEAIKSSGVNNLVFASSSSVYGNLINSKQQSIKENDIKHDIYSPYAATKLSCEAMIDVYSNLYKVNSISLRYFTVFGPNQRPDLAIIKFMAKIYKGQQISKFGDGDTFRDYTYIDDVVEANIKSLEKNFVDGIGGHTILNISSKNPITLNELIKKEESVIGKKAIVEQKEMQLGDVFGTYGDNLKAKEFLEWNPSISFEEGLSRTFNWLIKEGEDWLE